jgi:hypothetical protein
VSWRSTGHPAHVGKEYAILFFLVTYDGPTADDEIELMTAIQSLGLSFDLCYKSILKQMENRSQAMTGSSSRKSTL